MSKPPPIRIVMDLLARLRASTPSPEEQELLAVALNAMLFIGSTGQRHAFTDFLAYLESSAPPPVVAAFKNREEADAWLNSHSKPPDSALVLIADQYHTVMSNRDRGYRRLVPLSIIEFHLGRLKREGLPPMVAAFKNREEAESWLALKAESPAQSLVTIAGEDHLAVFHPEVNHRALYPFSRALDEEPSAGES